MATGKVGLTLRTVAIILAKSVLIFWRTPITLNEETQYKKPVAF